MKYDPVRNLPVAKFWYQGHHTHPVRRTVLIVKTTPTMIVGYELRDGNTVRTLKKAPIKSYRKDKIALARQLRPGNKLRVANEDATTLVRESVMDMLKTGI